MTLALKKGKNNQVYVTAPEQKPRLREDAIVMGMVKRDVDKGRHLADLLDYSTPASMKRAVRSLLKLQMRAEGGCPTSAAILVDVKTALGAYKVDEVTGRRVLTSRQRNAILLHLVEDFSIQEVADRLGIDSTAVSHRINSGIKRVIMFLRTGKAGPAEWEGWEEDCLRLNYYTLGANAVAEKLERPLSQVYAKARTMTDFSKPA